MSLRQFSDTEMSEIIKAAKTYFSSWCLRFQSMVAPAPGPLSASWWEYMAEETCPFHDGQEGKERNG